MRNLRSIFDVINEGSVMIDSEDLYVIRKIFTEFMRMSKEEISIDADDVLPGIMPDEFDISFVYDKDGRRYDCSIVGRFIDDVCSIDAVFCDSDEGSISIDKSHSDVKMALDAGNLYEDMCGKISAMLSTPAM